MKRIFSIFLLLGIVFVSFAQKDAKYIAGIKQYQKKYVAEHEVVKKEDKKYFRFFPVNSKYNLNCKLERITDTVGFTLKTSAGTTKHYYKYGRLDFRINDTACHLFVYQSKDLMTTDKYQDYLFVPFTDATTGDESYGSGRYIEFYIKDIKNNTVQLDLNKAYNPYCAYATGFRCPIPPKENALAVAIKAGEKNFAKLH